MGVIAQTRLDLTAMHGRSRTSGNCSSTAVPDAVLPRQPLPALLYLLHPCSRPPALESYLLHPCRLPVLRGISASDLHGRRKCRRIVGTIPAMYVRTILAMESYLPTSDRQGWWKYKRIIGNNPGPVGRRCNGGHTKGLTEHSGQRVNPT